MNKYDRRHIANVRRYQRGIENIYKTAAEEIAQRAAGLPVPDDDIFSLADHPRTMAAINALVDDMRKQITFTVSNGIRDEWALSNKKNDALVDEVLAGRAKTAEAARWYRLNNEARDAFLVRVEGGMNLSDRVWRYTNQFKGEIELGLDCGLRDGLDAGELARQLKQYLQFPDKLFRRVRDEHGVLQLSRRAAAFHPGQGVYRSSYKNARRLAATETNMAYRQADYDRWQQLEMVVGIEIRLSNNHTCLNRKGKPVAFYDICDELKGKYPKDFKFVGWHPHCRCIVTPIKKSREEIDADLDRLLEGQPALPPETSENYVKDMPDNWDKWIDSNEDRITRAKSMPYFIRDNFKDGDPSKGLRWLVGTEKPHINAEPAFSFEPFQLPRTQYVTDTPKMSYMERVENLLKGIVESDPSRKDWTDLVRSVTTNEANAKTNWRIIKGFHTPDHLRMLETSKHINELLDADLSAIPERWRGTMSELIRRINAHDVAKNGYVGIYADVEHAYNIYRLSTTPQCIEYGIARLSDKTPYNLFTELRKKFPEFGIPSKEFFDRFDQFVPLMTTGSGAYHSPSYGHVCIAVKDADNVLRLNTSKWMRDNLAHHEYGHALDWQRGLRTKDNTINGIFDDWADEVAKDNGASLEAKIKEVLKAKKEAFYATWEQSETKKNFDDAQMAVTTWEESRKISKERQKTYKRLYAEAMYDIEEQVGAFSDCLAAALKGKRVISPRCHPGTYFKIREMQLAEFIAHASENYWGGNPYFKELAPKLYEAMLKWQKGL